MKTLLRLFSALSFFFLLASCSDDDNNSATTCTQTVDTSGYNYLMAYHTCESASATCSDPSNHIVGLAGSADGVSWTAFTEFSSYAGSVPDLGTDGTYIYIYTGDGNIRVYDSNLCLRESTSLSLSGTDTTFVDPSFYSEDGTNYIFYLPGTPGSDPAGCDTYPCTKNINSMESSSSSFTSFTQSSGNRISETLSSGAVSDPDIIKFGSTYLLYISEGQNVSVYTSSTITGSYSDQGQVSVGEGGVPSAIVGDDGDVWLYTTYNNGSAEVIQRGTSSDGTTAPSSFSEVLSGSDIGETATTYVSSPSILDKPTNW